MSQADAEDRLTLTLIRGEIAGLPQADQEKVTAAASQLRTIVQSFGQHGVMAMALVGAELQVMAI